MYIRRTGISYSGGRICCEVGQFCDKMFTESVEYVCEMEMEIADARSVRPIKTEARNKERIGNYGVSEDRIRRKGVFEFGWCRWKRH